MHALHGYLVRQLNERLAARSVVVFYDPRREFTPFIERELEEAGSGYDGLPRVFIGERLTFLARYSGSYFGLRAAIEPLVAADRPEPLLIYLPGEERDRRGSVLMELEKAGDCYEPPLRKVARNVLRQRLTDGQIDTVLAPEAVTYEDIVAVLDQTDLKPSVLRVVFGDIASEDLLVAWLASDQHDTAIVSRKALQELLSLIEARVGLELPPETTVEDARAQTARYLLVNEFRADLTGPAPPSLELIASPARTEQSGRVRSIAADLRGQHAAEYVLLADGIEQSLGLGASAVDPASLGAVDTFRFEEMALLDHVGRAVAARQYPAACKLAEGRADGFWAALSIGRRAQWEVCRRLAELGAEIQQARLEIKRQKTDPSDWVAAYAGDGGWHRVDGLQRQLETWVARLEDDPPFHQALAVVRREYEDLLMEMAEGFVAALRGHGWTVAGFLPQASVFADVVPATSARTAYFLVDALRFEMAGELAQQFSGADDLQLRPAIAALPTLTPVGMAALLPGAAISFTLQAEGERLAARCDGAVLTNANERTRFLKARVPGVAELTLARLLEAQPSKLKHLQDAPLVVVRSQEIDFAGEQDRDTLARQVMDTVIGNLARGIRKLSSLGLERFVITADHGHQFALRKDEDMRTASPGGDTLELHRRCWVGRGGTTPPGTVRVSGADLGYQTDLEFVFPTGTGVFRAGGGLGYHHGGCSLQELVIPVLTLGLVPPRPTKTGGQELVLSGVPATLTNRTFGIYLELLADLLVKALDVRVLLLSGSEQVGQAGMAHNADLDRTTGIVRLYPGKPASVGLLLTRDDCPSVRVFVQDAATDAVLARSDEIPIKLGM